MMCMYLSMWTHSRIYSWKLGPGLILLAKVCPWFLILRNCTVWGQKSWILIFIHKQYFCTTCGQYYKIIRSVTDISRNVIDDHRWCYKLWHHVYDRNWWHLLRLGYNCSAGVIHDDHRMLIINSKDHRSLGPYSQHFIFFVTYELAQ